MAALVEIPKKWFGPNWRKYRDDWLNLNTALAVIMYGVVMFACSSFLAVGVEKANIQAEMRPVLSSLISFFPGLLIVLAFGAYRGFYRGGDESNKQSRRIVTWRRYALPLSILMSMTTIFLAGFLYEDLAFSADVYSRGFAFGVFTFPLHYDETELSIPSLIFWAGYLGYLMTLVGITLRRIITNNLVPHFYIASSFNLIKSLVAAVLIFLVLDAMPGLFQADVVQLGNKLNPSLAILIAFTAGATADDVIAWVIGRMRRLFGRNTAAPLPLSLVQGIDPTLEAFLHDEGIDSIQALATTPQEVIAEKVGLDASRVGDWQSQANFLRNLSSAALAERFHRLGINELNDLKALDEDELAKALAAVNEKDDLGNESVNKVLLKVLKAEMDRPVAVSH